MRIHKPAVISFFILSITYAAAQNKGSASSADITAEKIWTYLHHFFFEDNDIIALPARLYGRSVRFIEVKVENSWLQSEPYYPLRNPDNWQVSK